MKKLFLVIILITSINCFSQTDYYSTNGKDRLNKIELEKVKSDLKEKYERITKKKLFVSTKTKKTIKKKDSIIHFISFQIKDSISANNPLSKYLNKPLPETVLKDIKGKEISLTQFHGKPTLINFWFTTCKPCIDEMTTLNKFYDQYKDDYNFIAITFEPKERVENFLKNHAYKFIHIVDAKVFTDKLEIIYYPLNLFLDKQGVVRFSENGIPYESKDGKSVMGDGKKFIKNLEELK